MCGLFGVVSLSLNQSLTVTDVLNSVSEKLIHRGPDASGHYIAPDEKVIFFHRRLKIHDLSEESAQPMTSCDGSVTLVFNGEIYNFKVIRETLKDLGYTFKTSGDTEVLLAAYLHWGENFIDKLDGMYAVIIHDMNKNCVLVYRDFFGEKPLYYSEIGRCLYFCSELRPLLGLQTNGATLAKESVIEYLSRGYVSGSRTLIENIFMVEKNSFLKINLNDFKKHRKRIGYHDNEVQFSDHISSFDRIFGESVRDKLASDVPVGVLLSGGLDSSLVVAKAAEFKSGLNTYNISFSGSNHSQADSLNAKAIAKHFGSVHSHIELDSYDMEFFISSVGECDDLINDPSLIPTFLVYKAVSRDCRVILGGDGADEMFGGYRRYFNADKIQFFNTILPAFQKKFGSNLVKSILPHGAKGRYFMLSMLQRDLKSAIDLPTLFEKDQIEGLLDIPFHNKIQADDHGSASKSYLETMCDFDIENYLPDNILIKVDRMSMLNSVEARSPFLSKSIYNFSQGLQDHQKVASGKGKIFLHEYAKTILPPNYNFNAKNGFSPPFKDWLIQGGPLRAYAQELLFDDICGFDNSVLQKLFQRFDRGANISRHLLALIFLQIWVVGNKIKWF